MKAKKWTALILALILALAPAWAGEGEGDEKIPSHPRNLDYPPLDYDPPQRADHRRVLSNGVVAYMVEDHNLPLFEVTVLVRAGEYLEPEGKEGLADATANQLRSGGTESLAPRDFDEEVDFLAANISSRMGNTSAQAGVNALSKDVDRALELFFEMLRKPRFDQERLDLYKRQVLQQMERRNDRTSVIERREWNRLIHGPDFFINRHPTKATIESMTRQDLAEFHRKHYHPGNFILAVSGDFDSDRMAAKLERAMEGWEAGERSPEVPEPDYTPRPGVYLVNKSDVNQGRVSIGHPGLKEGHPQQFAVDMMNDILGGSGFTSRITNRVRSDEGLAYTAGSVFSFGSHYRGQFRALFQSKSPTVAQAAAIVLEEIDRIRREPVSQDELDTVKNSAIEIFPRFFSSADNVATRFANDELIGRDEDYWNVYRDRIRSVTVEDVARAAQEHLHPDNLVILIVGNVEDILEGHPDRPQYSIAKLPGGNSPVRIPLPDPMTMVYEPN